MRREMVKHRPKTRLTVAGIVIVFLTFLFGRVLTDTLKESVDSLTSAISEYRSELGTTTTSDQIANLQLQMTAASEKGALAAPTAGKDYTPMITEDLGTLEQRRDELNVDMDDTSRLVDALPRGADDLRKFSESVRPYVDKANRGVDDLKKPGQTNDWNRALKVKVGPVPVLIAEIGVVVVGDAALTRANQVRDAREKIYHFCLWTSYVLYALGIILTLYGVLSGVGPIPANA